MFLEQRNPAATSRSVCTGCGIMSLWADWHSQQDLSNGFPWCWQKRPPLHPQPLCRSGPFANAGSRIKDKRLQGQKQGISKRNWLFKTHCKDANSAWERFSITVLKSNQKQPTRMTCIFIFTMNTWSARVFFITNFTVDLLLLTVSYITHYALQLRYLLISVQWDLALASALPNESDAAALYWYFSQSGCLTPLYILLKPIPIPAAASSC